MTGNENDELKIIGKKTEFGGEGEEEAAEVDRGEFARELGL